MEMRFGVGRAVGARPVVLRSMTLLGALTAVLVMSGAADAHADDGVGAFRVSLSADLIGWEKLSLDEGRERGLLLAPESSTEALTIGALDPRLGLELAGAITPELIIGVTGALTRREDSDDAQETALLAWTFLPYLELSLLPGGDIRPFFRASLGATGTDASMRYDGGGTASRSIVQFDVGATVGAHLFATPDVSFDPFLQLRYRTGDATTASTGGSSGALEVSQGAETADFSIGVSLSVWIGGHTAEAPPEQEAAPQRASDDAVMRAPRTEPEGVFAQDLSIPGTAGSRLRSRPADDGARVDLGLAIISPSPRFASCDVAVFRSAEGEGRGRARVLTRPFRSGVEETLVIETTHDVVSLLQGARAHLELCGVVIELDVAARSAARSYVLRFRSLARAAGTLVEHPDPVVPPTAPEAPIEPETSAPETAEPATSEQ